MPRATTILALLQTMLIVAGFCALGIVLKVTGYPLLEGARWNPLAVALREHGMWLLVFPVLWVLFATLAHRRNRGILSDRFAYALGVSLSCAVVGLFLYVSVAPISYYPILIIGR